MRGNLFEFQGGTLPAADTGPQKPRPKKTPAKLPNPARFLKPLQTNRFSMPQGGGQEGAKEKCFPWAVLQTTTSACLAGRIWALARNSIRATATRLLPHKKKISNISFC